MKAAIVSKQGSPVAPNIKVICDWAPPVSSAAPCSPGHVVIRTEASALNQLDLWVGRGVPGMDLTYPRISGSDGVGIVEALGPGVDSSWLNKRVILNAAVSVPESAKPGVESSPDIRMIGEHDHGTNAERFMAPISNLLDIGSADPVEAAAFGLVHLTAWRMLVSRARIRHGQSVLITGIGGGVALAALNIARHFCCTIIVTSRSKEKLERAKSLGAHHCVLDTGADWSREVRSLTGKRGVDICVDSIGTPVHLACIKSLARGGTFVTCGTTAGNDPPTDLARVFWNQLSILGSTMGDMHEFREVVSLFTAGNMKPVIDQVFPADRAAEAFARLESAQQFGKIVIRW
ncbi:MAG TPA: zinc-binding dehydrogenase [Phycisphaerales bacterium]|nr:zinc-binding dehydrogenase [Phycisphaerales bacterium]